MVLLGWSLCLLSAICYGLGSALQALAARTVPASRRMDALLLARVLRRLPFVAGIALDLVGFAAQIAALRILPLFVVQAVQASNLAVTAVVAIPMLGLRLRRVEWIAIIGVCVGLVLLGLSSGPQGTATPPGVLPAALLVSAAAAAVAGWFAGRLSGRTGSLLLGTFAGVQFAIVALAARSLTVVTPLALVRDPASYALAVGGVFGFLFFTTGLQRGAVTTVTGAVVVAETVLPAAAGVLLLGDGTRPGEAPVAFTGFVLSVAAALMLARFGEALPPPRP